MFAFYAIGKFLDMQKKVQIEKFVNDLQTDVNTAFGSSHPSKIENYTLPKKIDSVCFDNREYENMFFRPSGSADGRLIEHLDIEKIIQDEEPFCIENIDGKVSMIIEKDYGESLVTITK